MSAVRAPVSYGVFNWAVMNPFKDLMGSGQSEGGDLDAAQFLEAISAARDAMNAAKIPPCPNEEYKILVPPALAERLAVGRSRASYKRWRNKWLRRGA
jgi:hypothetical protein